MTKLNSRSYSSVSGCHFLILHQSMYCLDQISVAHGCHVDQAVYEASSELLQLLATNLLITSTPSVAWEFFVGHGWKLGTRAAW
jgi:hypothetical protein